VTPTRVLYSFPTRLGTPGIGTTAWHQVAGLVEQGVEVTLVCGSLERPLPGLGGLVETMRIAGRRLPYRAIGVERAARRHDRIAARLVARRSADFDIAHAWPLGAERTLVAARAAGVVGVLERPNAHTRFAFETVADECRRLGIEVDASSPHAFDAARLAREEREYRAAAYLLCPSDFVRETFVDAGFPAERLLRHQYGFDPSMFHLDAEPSDEPFTATFVGRAEPRKGLHLALRAWLDAGLGENGRFLVCGELEPAYRERIAPMLEHPSVEVRGSVTNPAEVMRSSHALVLPSLEEGSALVTYEARACGCVLVVSNRSGATARPGADALVHSAGDVDALARDLARLASDVDLRRRLREASVARLDELTWAAAGRRLAQVYSEALITPAGRAPGVRAA
jgi:glycosyltransferase involved in cell wall biosynthesis